MTRNVKIAAGLLACSAGLVAMFAFGAVRIAEGIEIGDPYGGLMREMERVSALSVPDFTLDCEEEAFSNAGWGARLRTSVNVIHWANEARGYELDFTRYNRIGQEKLAAIAATQGIEYWSDVAHAKKELECYEVAALAVKGPATGNSRARRAAEISAREAAEQKAACELMMQDYADAAANAADAAAAAADAAAAEAASSVEEK